MPPFNEGTGELVHPQVLLSPDHTCVCCLGSRRLGSVTDPAVMWTITL